MLFGLNLTTPLRNWLANRKLTQQEEAIKRELGWSATCPGCGALLLEEMVRFRDTGHHWHYMCRCGTVSHWLLVMFPVYVGHGRWRLNTKANDPNNGMVYPNRRLPGEPLYYYPASGLYYLPARDGMVALKHSELPPRIRFQQGDILLEAGMKIQHGEMEWVFDGNLFKVPYPENL